MSGEGVVQVDLEQWVTTTLSRHTTAWVDKNDKRFEEGQLVTLVHEKGWWLVKKVYTVEKEKSTIHQDWEVGGLTKT